MESIGLNLWKKRVTSFGKEVVSYSRYIANSGSVGFLILALSGGAYYYSQLLRSLPSTLPVEWGIALLFTFLLARGRVRTFMKEADQVFLLPAEEKMVDYFKPAIAYSVVIQSIVLFLFLLLLWPLYTHRMGAYSLPFLGVFIGLVAIKGLNLLAAWYEMRLEGHSIRRYHVWIRGLSLFPLLYFLFSRGFSLPWLGAFIGVVLVSYGYYRWIGQQHLPHWGRLIQEEMRAMSRFYRFINGFIDVPGISGRIHRRQWLSGVTHRLQFTQKNTYTYLILKSFIRSDLSGMAFRLTLLGWLVIFFLPGDWGKGTAFVTFLYLVGIQLVGLRQIHAHVFWFSLYPINPKQRTRAIKQVTEWTLWVVSFLLWIPLTIGFQSVYLPLIGFITALSMVLYLRRRTA